MFFCCKQKTAYELRISDWSSAVCAAYLRLDPFHQLRRAPRQVAAGQRAMPEHVAQLVAETVAQVGDDPIGRAAVGAGVAAVLDQTDACLGRTQGRSEEHTSELQSLMRISYAVFCLKKKKKYKPLT